MRVEILESGGKVGRDKARANKSSRVLLVAVLVFLFIFLKMDSRNVGETEKER